MSRPDPLDPVVPQALEVPRVPEIPRVRPDPEVPEDLDFHFHLRKIRADLAVRSVLQVLVVRWGQEVLTGRRVQEVRLDPGALADRRFESSAAGRESQVKPV